MSPFSPVFSSSIAVNFFSDRFSCEFFRPRSKRLFSWKNVFDVNDGELEEFGVCNKDDSIF